MEEVEITRHGRPEQGEYRIVLPDASGTAKLSWTGDDQTRIARSTYVPPSMRGRGIAGRLVRRLVEDARAEGFKIVPLCNYVEWAFDRNPDWSDLLADQAAS